MTQTFQDSVELKNSHGILVEKARDEFLKRFKDEDIQRAIGDRFGIIGYESYYKVICAKKYVYGNIVSCHESLVRRAIEQEKGLLMYILNTNKFYLFNPSRIMESGTRNFRVGACMLNFSVKRGINAETGLRE